MSQIFAPKRSGLKAIALTFLIAVGIFAECSTASAAEARAYFAGGCFWCVESDFESVRGVKEVRSGYTGGDWPDPTYRAVSKGKTGHLEAVEIIYDPNVVSYDRLLHLFFRSVDPTDAGGQFCDRGKHYTSAIFVGSEKELTAAKKAKAKAQKDLGQEVVTPLRKAGAFYPAEEYHQDYYKKSDIVITRFGPLSKSYAYERYRLGCGRDKRVKELWGNAAPFAKKAGS